MKIIKFGVITEAEDTKLIRFSDFIFEPEEGEFLDTRCVLQAVADYMKDKPEGEDLIVLKRDEYERSIY